MNRVTTRVQDAVILAAGCGSRLPSNGVPKPLVMLGGMRMLERTARNLSRAGITRITVVTGFQNEALEAGIATIDVPGVQFRTVLNAEWRKPNGISLYVARDVVTADQFVLTMADHLFDYTIVSDLIAFGTPGDGCCLAVDENVGGVFDIDDATKVLTRDGLIVSIGKEIPDYNAIDCGLFLCSRAIFSALGEAIDQGRMSLSDGMKLMGARGRFAAMPIGGRYWQDVDDEPMFRKAEMDIAAGLIF